LEPALCGSPRKWRNFKKKPAFSLTYFGFF
jgi:hypothetical protein